MNPSATTPPDTTATAVGALVSGVYILTTQTEAEQPIGMMASWVQQAGFSPLTVTVAIHPERAAFVALQASQRFTLNVVGQDGPTLMRAFARPSDNPFENLDLEPNPHGVVLKEAVACLHCQVRQIVTDHSDHALVIAEVVGGRRLQPDNPPFVHMRKSGLNY